MQLICGECPFYRADDEETGYCTNPEIDEDDLTGTHDAKDGCAWDFSASDVRYLNVGTF